jgi:tetratricopeptide (TPR) repeat protein
VVIPAAAQNAGLENLVDRSLAAMNAGNWQESLDIGSEAVARFGKEDPLAKFGPQFGALYYRQGICEMKLGRWNEAMRSFEVCYRDFPNSGTDRGNAFQKMALLKWGESAMAAQNWDLAVRQFEKFIGERDKVRDGFAHGVFYINLAVCHYHMGNIPDGNENLEIAMNNRDAFPTPESGIFAGFEALVNAAILKHNERALLDFIGKNRAALLLDPYPMHRYSRVLMKLAGDAVTAGMQRAAISLYQLVPDTEISLGDARARLPDATEPSEKVALENDIAGLEAELRGGNPPEAIRLAALALIHEKNGSILCAVAAYQQLEWYYPNAANREENLYNLVRTSSRISASDKTHGFADIFIRDFPNSPHVMELKEMMK